MLQSSLPIESSGIVWVDVLRFISQGFKKDIRIVNLIIILFGCFEGVYTQSGKDNLAITKEKPYFEIGVDAANSLVWRCNIPRGQAFSPHSHSDTKALSWEDGHIVTTRMAMGLN